MAKKKKKKHNIKVNPRNYPGQNTGMGSLSLLQRIFQPRDWIQSALQAYSFPAEPQGKPYGDWDWAQNQGVIANSRVKVSEWLENYQEETSWSIRLQCRRPAFDPWLGKISWRRERLPTPVFWPGEFHGLYSPLGSKESDMREPRSLSLPALGWLMAFIIGRKWCWLVEVFRDSLPWTFWGLKSVKFTRFD